MEYELYHHGILGMKWGIRRFQNKDGTLTAAGRKRYGSSSELTKAVINKNTIEKRLNSVGDSTSRFPIITDEAEKLGFLKEKSYRDSDSLYSQVNELSVKVQDKLFEEYEKADEDIRQALVDASKKYNKEYAKAIDDLTSSRKDLINSLDGIISDDKTVEKYARDFADKTWNERKNYLSECGIKSRNQYTSYIKEVLRGNDGIDEEFDEAISYLIDKNPKIKQKAESVLKNNTSAQKISEKLTKDAIRTASKNSRFDKAILKNHEYSLSYIAGKTYIEEVSGVPYRTMYPYELSDAWYNYIPKTSKYKH